LSETADGDLKLPTRVGIQSIESGAPLMRALVGSDGPMTLAALSKATGMPRSKAHKYLASYIRIGLVTQSEAGGRYDLGPFALDIALAAMRRLDVMKLAQDALDALRDELTMTISMAVWANRGPALVRWAATPQTSPGSRLGTVFPLLNSTVGLIFAAYLDRSQTQTMLQAELAERGGPRTGPRSMAQVDALLEQVRAERLASSISTVAPGMATICAPVFDVSNRIVAAIAVVGLVGQINLSLDGREARALARAAQKLSRQLGAHPDASPIQTTTT